mmetsp:Transcript_23746/g.25991  ORF Transcript_23746/g.25991 Transcript_23746/m.25991 type:complete len:783 (-) Transcript_23746:142-2490(-)
MPVRGEYRWNETSDSLRIEIPLKGVSPKKVDIFVSTSVLKINYSPYLVEIFLLKEVDAVKHKATVKDGVLTITLMKKIPEHWGTLEISLEEYERDQKKEHLLKKKQEALEQRTALEQKLAAEATDRKITEERHAVKQQMALDEEFRNRLDQLKADEKKAAEEEVYRTFAALQQNNQNFAGPSTTTTTPTDNAPPTTTTSTNPDSTLPKDKEDSKRLIHEDVLLESYDMIDDLEEDEALSPQKHQKSPPSNTTSADEKQSHRYVSEPNEDGLEEEEEEEEEREVIETEADDIKYIPPPRHQTLDTNADSSKVKINFTPRLFPTPMRESKAAEEEDWIAKNRRHLKRHGVLGKGLNKKGGANTGDVSEEDPVWLKAKGDDFFRNGDIRSALNAYSAAIDAYDVDFTLFTTTSTTTSTTLPRLEANLIACLSNRSLCYLKLNLSQDCKIDCDIIVKSVQLQLSDLPPPPPSTSSTDAAGVVDTNQAERMKLWMTSIKLLLRRGLVHCQLGKYTDSLADYTQAHVIMQQQLSTYYLEQLSHNYHITIETIQSDINRLKMILTAENAKKKGDILFADRAIDNAIEQYSHAIELIPIYVSAYSNRSACYLMKNELELSISDCNFALDILTLKEDEELLNHHHQQSSSSSSRSGGPAVINFSTKTISSSSPSSSNFQVLRAMLHAIIPLPATDKHKQWLLNISLKKAVALIQSQRYEEAIEVYEKLQTLDPQNETIKQDLNNLRQKFQQQIEESKKEEEKDKVLEEDDNSFQSKEKRSSVGITDLDDVE